jgi:hypothetical protein
LLFFAKLLNSFILALNISLSDISLLNFFNICFINKIELLNQNGDTVLNVFLFVSSNTLIASSLLQVSIKTIFSASSNSLSDSISIIGNITHLTSIQNVLNISLSSKSHL